MVSKRLVVETACRLTVDVLNQIVGSIVRIGPNTLSFNTVTALKTIYGSRQANVQKADWYRTIDAGSKAFSVHSEIDKSKHAFRRRVIDQAFSDQALTDAESLIIENTQDWMDCLCANSPKNGWSPSRNMNDWCNWLSFDMMGDMTFGRDFGCVVKGEHRFVPDVVLSATKFVYVVMIMSTSFPMSLDGLTFGLLLTRQVFGHSYLLSAHYLVPDGLLCSCLEAMPKRT